jgi:hypothetical protein
MTDLIGSFVVVLLPVAFVAGMVAWLRPSTFPEREVPLQPAAQAAAASADFRVLAPRLPEEGYRVTGAQLREGPPPRWRVNVVTPAGGYAGLVQSSAPVRALVVDVLPDAAPAGSSDVHGVTWERWAERGDRPDVALTREDPDLGGVVVISSEGFAEAEAFAARLAPVSPSADG